MRGQRPAKIEKGVVLPRNRTTPFDESRLFDGYLRFTFAQQQATRHQGHARA